MSATACAHIDGPAASGDAAQDSADADGGTTGTSSVDAGQLTLEQMDLEAPAGICASAAEWVRLVYDLDGDTLKIDDGNLSSVRLLGVSAAEIDHGPKRPAECYGVHAWETVKSWLPEGAVNVCVKPDPAASNKDMYGRLLRYVYFKDSQGRVVQLNARLIRTGEARMYRHFAKGLAMESEFDQRETKARQEALGGWQECAWQPL